MRMSVLKIAIAALVSAAAIGATEEAQAQETTPRNRTSLPIPDPAFEGKIGLRPSIR